MSTPPNEKAPGKKESVPVEKEKVIGGNSDDEPTVTISKPKPKSDDVTLPTTPGGLPKNNAKNKLEKDVRSLSDSSLNHTSPT
jgi:hypothetical protein